ncbi:MAG: GNAT family N-acetyltransferase [Segniliparus sp.]|uniref:GNAT family N-acetyltransferase n=1 Tax=Segniliparus sp. TaxID=2804064 RepID=UPI003F2AA7FE
MRHVVLVGDGIWLSAPTAADVPAITACCQEPGLAEMTSSIPIPFAEADARHFVTEMVGPEWSQGTSLTWAVRLQEAGEAVGMVGLHGCGRFVSPAAREGGEEGFAFDQAELGYWLSAKARSRGIMTDAARRVCEFGFDALRLRAIRWQALVGNAPSARVARRAGFRFTGVGWFEDWRGSGADVWTAALRPEEFRGSGQGPLPQGWPDGI